MRRPGAKDPSNFMPNQLPNSVESASARQTRFSGARRRIFFSIRSVSICNLLVAYISTAHGDMQPKSCALFDKLSLSLGGVAGSPDKLKLIGQARAIRGTAIPNI